MYGGKEFGHGFLPRLLGEDGSQEVTIADELAALLREMQITSSIAEDVDSLRMGQDGFDRMISIDPSDHNWKKKAIFFFAGGTSGIKVIFAPLEIPRAIESGEQVRDAANRVLLRHLKLFDSVGERRVIERFDGLFRVEYA